MSVAAVHEIWGDIRVGSLEVRLALSAAEVDAAQALRYRIFYEEMRAKPTPEMAARHRDADAFDEICDHLLVLDHARDGDPVVGTYRLLRRSVADRLGRSFYTASEYDIAPILAQPGELLELGRSCVDGRYRNRATMQLLWRGIAAYVSGHDITLMFGCASFPGTDPAVHALPLSYLYHFHLAPAAMRPRTLPDLYVDMNRLPKEAIDARAALLALPPLVKGYLRLGGFVGDGAYVDRQFNTTDVCIIVKTDLVTRKYRERLT
ncbi:MAG TPA: GNAT family N-acyltransferase [Alphaproteobacteria bacterium]|nr:GNAT family N-acyltransferase [Alphaproteobacteria bacterium]